MPFARQTVAMYKGDKCRPESILRNGYRAYYSDILVTMQSVAAAVARVVGWGIKSLQ